MTEKLQKVLANVGFGSRRTMEAWIEAGRVMVNGQVATIGDRAGIEDKIVVDGKAIMQVAQNIGICSTTSRRAKSALGMIRKGVRRFSIGCQN